MPGNRMSEVGVPDEGIASAADVIKFIVVGVAQLVRAPDCGSGGRGFESHHPPQDWQ